MVRDDLLYMLLLVVSAWAVITSLWMLDYLLCKYWPFRGKKMEDDPHGWITKYLSEHEGKKGQRLRVLELEKEHLQRIKFFFADFVVDSLLLRQVNGDMDAAAVIKELDRIGNLFDIPDLLPRNQEALKEMIKQRRKDKERDKPVPLPDAKPKDKFNYAKVNPDPNARRHLKWHTSLRSWLRTRVRRHPMPTSK